MSWAEDIVPIPTGTLVLSPDDGCVGVVLEQSKQYLNAYRIQWERRIRKSRDSLATTGDHR